MSTKLTVVFLQQFPIDDFYGAATDTMHDGCDQVFLGQALAYEC